MANEDHLTRLRKDVDAWNQWREDNPTAEIDLKDADLKGANLSNADLSDADLTRAELGNANLNAANLSNAYLTRADMSWARLNRATLVNAYVPEANLEWASIRGTDLSEANLAGATLTSADMDGANLTRATLQGANLRHANLLRAILCKANLVEATMFNVELSDADLSGADLRSAILQYARLDRAIASGVKLWETQRAGWSIKDIVCGGAYWDEYAAKLNTYAHGEFERLHSDQNLIEFFYEGGVSTFELNTLPAILHHLASLHPGAHIRLKSVEETGGGAKISLSVGDADSQTVEKIKADAMQVYQGQLALRENEIQRLKIVNDYLETSRQENLIKAMFAAVKELPALQAAAAPQIVNYGSMTGIALAAGHARQEVHQSINDNSALLTLLEKMLDRRADLNLPAQDAAQLKTEFESATAELEKPNPDRSVLSKSIEFIQKLATEAVTKAAGKLGESAVTDWPTWLHQLAQFAHRLKY